MNESEILTLIFIVVSIAPLFFLLGCFVLFMLNFRLFLIFMCFPLFNFPILVFPVLIFILDLNLNRL